MFNNRIGLFAPVDETWAPQPTSTSTFTSTPILAPTNTNKNSSNNATAFFMVEGEKETLFFRFIEGIAAYAGIDFSSGKVMDINTGQIYFFSEATLPYNHVKKLHGDVPLAEKDININVLHHSPATSIKLAVAGGEIMRLFMGECQPKCYVTARKDSITQRWEYYRLSSEIEHAYDYDSEKNPLPNGVPFYGIISMMIYSRFLGDDDIKNFFLQGHRNKEGMLIALNAVRYDPELCFGEWFIYNKKAFNLFIEYLFSEETKAYRNELDFSNESDVNDSDSDSSDVFDSSTTKQINDLYNINKNDDIMVRDKNMKYIGNKYLFGDKIPEPIFNIFQNPFFNEENSKFVPYFNDVQQRREEVYIALFRIISHAEEVIKIINMINEDDLKDNKVKKILIDSIKEKTKWAIEIADSLKGYKEYIENKKYLDNISYQIYFGDTQVENKKVHYLSRKEDNNSSKSHRPW